MHELERIAGEANRTHPNMGPLVATTVMCTVARRMLLVVAPAGCGKSTGGRVVLNTHPNAKPIDSVTRAGLRDYAEAFTDFSGVVLTDDLGKTGGKYHRMEIMLAFAELVYTGYMGRTTVNTSYAITNFKGSALLNCQPVVLRDVLVTPEWDATIADKTIRYYHVYRPTDPVEVDPSVHVNWDVSFDKVAPPDIDTEPYSSLVRLGWIQWGRARSREHVRAMLRACAAIDGRDVVTEDDARVLKELMRPMTLEKIVVYKTGWEDGRHFDVGLLCLLIEFASYGAVHLDDIMVDYKLDEHRARGLMEALNKWWTVERNGGVVYKPTPEMATILDKIRPKLESEDTSETRVDSGISGEGGAVPGAAKGRRKANTTKTNPQRATV